jgi:hypothetical protein
MIVIVLAVTAAGLGGLAAVLGRFTPPPEEYYEGELPFRRK